MYVTKFRSNNYVMDEYDAAENAINGRSDFSFAETACKLTIPCGYKPARPAVLPITEVHKASKGKNPYTMNY